MNSLGFYSETLNALSEYNVRYLVVGGYAVNSYGYMRSTGDMDLWIDTSKENLKNTAKALQSLAYPEKEISLGIEELSENRIINLKHNEFYKIELIPFLSSTIKFTDAFQRKATRSILGTDAHVIDFEDLCDLKIRSGRYKDLLDVHELRRLNSLK
jgi:predicted nucleotidyltransferase